MWAASTIDTVAETTNFSKYSTVKSANQASHAVGSLFLHLPRKFVLTGHFCSSFNRVRELFTAFILPRISNCTHSPHIAMTTDADEVPPPPALHAGPGARELGASAGGDRRDGCLLPDPAAGRAAISERPRVGGNHPGRVHSTDAGCFDLQLLETRLPFLLGCRSRKTALREASAHLSVTR